MNINWAYAYGNPTPGKEYMLVHHHTTWFMYCSFTILVIFDEHFCIVNSMLQTLWMK